MALLRETSLIHEYHTVDGQLKLVVTALAVDGTREHRLYLTGCSLAGTLVEMGVKGSEDSSVTEVLHLGLVPLQVGNGHIEGKCLGGPRGTHNDKRGVCSCADNDGKEVLFEGLGLCNASGELHLVDVPVQLITECLKKSEGWLGIHVYNAL